MMIDGINQFPAQTYFYQKDMIDLPSIIIDLDGNFAIWFTIQKPKPSCSHGLIRLGALDPLDPGLLSVGGRIGEMLVEYSILAAKQVPFNTAKPKNAINLYRCLI